MSGMEINKWNKDKWVNGKPHIKNNMRVLDIGCSSCLFFDYLKQNGINTEAVGFDIDKNKLKVAKKKNYVCYDSLKEVKGKFDIITMWEVIEHMPLNGFLDYLEWIRKHLKKEGKLIISTPNILNIFYPFWSEPTHIKPYSLDSLSRVLKSNGFEIISKKMTHRLKHPLKIVFCLSTTREFHSKMVVVAKPMA